MHLIFIRHGDPDYEHNTVTAKGKRECALLAERAASWKNIAGVFVSPYGRAQDTARPLLEKLGASIASDGAMLSTSSPFPVETLGWLREFDHHIIDPRTGSERSVCWDWLPRDHFAEPLHFDRDRWHQTSTFRAAGIEGHYANVCAGLDAVLLRYGYKRTDERTAIYTCHPHLSPQEAARDTHLLATQEDLDARALVFVCHLGVMFTAIAHLTGISPVQLWQGFFVAPTSVTVLGAEERVPGEAVFRVQALGDVRHLVEAGEPPSASGFFGNVTVF